MVMDFWSCRVSRCGAERQGWRVVRGCGRGELWGREGRVALCARPERDALAARRHNPYPNSQMQIAQALFLDSHTIPYTGSAWYMLRYTTPTRSSLEYGIARAARRDYG
jgi:hypothetical protein